ncbi:hypothetical protein BH20ACI2_BH20ACI2_08130 [soil metagenome]
MPKPKKRPSKNAKTAERLLNESKLLAASKAGKVVDAGEEFRAAQVTPRTSTANKPRPHKKRG